MIETRFLIPLKNNDGLAYLRTDFIELEDRLLDQFGGWTHMADVDGTWRSDTGVVYRDFSSQYLVTLRSWRQTAEFLGVLDWARVKFEQEAIMVTIAGVPEILGPSS